MVICVIGTAVRTRYYAMVVPLARRRIVDIPCMIVNRTTIRIHVREFLCAASAIIQEIVVFTRPGTWLPSAGINRR